MKNMKWLALFFMILFFACSPNNNTSEHLSTPQIDEVETLPPEVISIPFRDLTKQEYSRDYSYGRERVPCVMTSPGVLHRRSTFTEGPILAVLVTVEEGYFGEEQSQNAGYFKLED
jgi:hypothetical protein